MSAQPLQSFAANCVSNYAKFDDEQYRLSVDELPDFVQHEFAALIIAEDKDRANESTAADNEQYYKDMLPTLISFLANSTDRDKEIEFVRAWRDGVTAYQKRYMQELIDDALHDYNSEHGHAVLDWNDYYGVAHLFR